MAPILGYWNIRGYAQPLRLMLAYNGEPFEDKRYAYGPAPEYSRDAWFKVKHTFGLAFPNLPYYIDGETKLTQTLAIMRHLARKFNLVGDTEEQQIRTDMVEQQGVDLRFALVSMAYREDFEKLKVDHLKNLPNLLKPFSEYLGENDWFAGDKLTYVDFLMYEILDQHLYLDSECLKEFPSLVAFHERFKQLPQIEKYMKSDDYLSFPLNGDMAYFASRRTQK